MARPVSGQRICGGGRAFQILSRISAAISRASGPVRSLEAGSLGCGARFPLRHDASARSRLARSAGGAESAPIPMPTRLL